MCLRKPIFSPLLAGKMKPARQLIEMTIHGIYKPP